MHGSDTQSPTLTTPPHAQALARQEQTHRLMVVQEAGATSAGIYAIANAACNEGHVTMEQMERITHLARQLCRNLDQLGINLSSTLSN
ncbi:hypothetical protein AB9U01_25220 [Pseudomonas qingdaonensis]|uniref:hypothetical protein n=1 Tax=Pseudomonas qingdaonensis TaxID=2056231 RepID=UPI0035161E54